MLERADPIAEVSTHGLMHGGGFYNRRGWMQAAGITAALPALARAAAAVPIEASLVVADYGSSQGRNSLRPMQVAIDGLRARATDAPITVVHTDQPGNDFASLFGLLADSPASYLNTHTQTYCAAVGRSFFDPILPPRSVTLGWSSFSAMWLTRVPPEAAGHVFGEQAPPPVLDLLRAQAETDWRRFLAARAEEMRPGARLVVLVAGPAELGSASTKPLKQIATTALRQCVRDGLLSGARCAQAFVPTMPRSAEQLRAPFADGPFAGLALEEQEDRADFPDAAWERYRQDCDLVALADAYVGFFQATFQPSLLHSLEPFGSASERKGIADALEASIRVAVTTAPQPCAQIPLHTVVLRRS